MLSTDIIQYFEYRYSYSTKFMEYDLNIDKPMNKEVGRLTYTQHWSTSGGEERFRSVGGLAGVFAVALECSLFVGLRFEALWHNDWACTFPHLAEVYDYIIHGMVYLSAAFTVEVKCLSTICHGPTRCCLLFKAKRAETIFEASLQLALL